MPVLKWLSLSIVVAVLDQYSKYLVTSNMHLGEERVASQFFSWVRWHNEGAAFNILSDAGGWQRWFFVVLGVVFAGFIIYELRRLPRTNWLMAFSYGMILGGALGNWIDRFWQGHVVDFLLFHYEHHYFPAFNLADSALFLGASIWLIVMVREYLQERKANLAG